MQRTAFASLLALKLVGFRGFTGTTRVILQQSLQVRRPLSTTLGQVPHDGKSLNISTTWETDACLKSLCSLGFRINPAPQQCVHCLQNKSRSFAKNEKYRTWPSCEVQISVLQVTSNIIHAGLPWWLGKESACHDRRRGFDPWVRKIPRRRKWQPTAVFSSGKSNRQRNQAWLHSTGSRSQT